MKPFASGVSIISQRIVQFIALVILIAACTQVQAQSTTNPSLEAIAEEKSNDFMIYYKPTVGVDPKTMFTDHAEAFGLVSGQDEMVITKEINDDLGYTHYRYQQYYRGLEVYGYTYVVHAKSNQAVKSNGDIAPGLALSISPSIGETDAIDKALSEMNAQTYFWENSQAEEILKLNNGQDFSAAPKGELIVVNTKLGEKNPADFRLAYKVDVYAWEPFGATTYFIDANTGDVLMELPLFLNCHTPPSTTAEALFEGPVTIQADELNAGDFALFDDCQPGPSVGILTMEMNGTSINHVFDNNGNNTWTDTIQSHFVQAHFGTRATYNYYYNNHSYSSYDGNGATMYSLVSNTIANNAYWMGNVSMYGMPGNLFDEWVLAMDVVGHEYTHGVVQSTADFIPGGEPGALNESFADIFGAMVEWESAADPDWVIGEDSWDVDNSPSGQMDFLRSMEDPKSQDFTGALQPDTYMEVNWGGGVHTNCGVQNFWFYLLCEGSANTDEINDVGGIEDAGDTYEVFRLAPGDPVESRRRAAAIAFRSLRVYLTSASGYHDARDASIEAAIDLFGACSHEVQQVINAWFAVGLGTGCFQACVETTPVADGNVCTANQTAEATVTIVTGGTPPFTFEWSNGQTTATATGLTTGSYRVTVTDSNSCQEELFFDISLLNGNVQVTEEHPCFGLNDGELHIEVTGGDAPFTYLWSTGSADAGIVGLAPGNYSVTVTDASGCTEVLNSTLAELAELTLDLQLISPSNCGYPSGSAEATVNNGVPTYDYTWIGPDGLQLASIQQIASGLAAGTYSVTAIDDNGCTATNDIVVPAAQGMEVTTTTSISDSTPCRRDVVTITYTICNTSGADATDSVLLQVDMIPAAGATIDPSSDFDANGQVTIPDFDLTDGACVTVTLNLNIWMESTFTVELLFLDGACPVTMPVVEQFTSSDLHIDSANFVQPTCFGDCDGAIDLFVGGGVQPITYQWNTGDTTPSLSNICGGFYQYTFTDSFGCEITFALHLPEPPPLITNLASTNTTCNDSTIIFSNVMGGTPGYTYVWSNGAGNFADITVSSPGVYSVTVTDSNGCEAIDTITINAASGFPVTVTRVVSDTTPCTGDTVNITYTICNNSGADATVPVDLDVVLMTQAHMDILNTSDFDVFGNFQIPDILLTDGACVPVSLDLLVTGGFTTDIELALTNACATTIVLDHIDAGGASNSVMTAYNNLCDPLCSGFLNLTLWGGSPPYTFNWSNGSTNQTQFNVCPGTYRVTITDDVGCDVVLGPEVIANNVNVAITFPNQTDASCSNSADGSITADASDGVPPYTYTWSNGASGATNSNFNPGTYTVSVVDFNGCTAEANVTIGGSSPITYTVTTTDESCDNLGGATISNETGGVGSYSYIWHDGPGSASRNDLSAGSYTVTVQDANNCSADQSFTVEGGQILDISIISDVNPTSICYGDEFTITYLICNSGTTTINEPIDLQVSLHTPNLNYTSYLTDDFDNNGEHTIPAGALVAGDCPGNPYIVEIIVEAAAGLSGPTFVDISASSANCSQPVTFTEFMDVGGPMVTPTVIDPTCYGDCDGSINLAITSDFPPVTIDWSNGETSNSLTDLCPEVYSVTITDDIGCEYIESFTISSPPGLEAGLTTSGAATCSGDSIEICVTATGGVGDETTYDYFWSTGYNATGLPGKCITVTTSGTYSVTVRDLALCTEVASTSVVIPDDITVSLDLVDEACDGSSLGSASVNSISGGTGPYTYTWSTGVANQSISNLPAGNYGISVTDANGCMEVIPFTIGLTGDLGISAVIVPVNCNGPNSGEIDITVSGGSGNYTYSWSTGATTEDITGLTFGSHSVTVTDVSGCSVEASYFVQVDAVLDIVEPPAAVITDASCDGTDDGAIDITVAYDDGLGNHIPITTGLTFAWSNGSTDEDLTNLEPGSYTVTVTNQYGCQVVGTYEVIRAVLTVTATVTNNVCFGSSDGAINLTVTNGDPPYTFAWDDGPTTMNRTNLLAGQYTVTVTSNGGACQTIETFTVGQPFRIRIARNPPHLRTENECFGDCIAIIHTFPVGGTPPYTYTWSPPVSTDSIASNLCAGIYNLTVEDANGCQRSASYVVGEPNELEVMGNVTNDCNNGSTGAVDLTVTGGTPGYAFDWSTGATSEDVTGLPAGTHTVTVTDANGCEEVQSFTIINSNVDMDVTHTDILCNGDDNGTITVNSPSGQTHVVLIFGPNLSDNFFGTNHTWTNLEPGDYDLYIFYNGCFVLEEVTIVEPSKLKLLGAILPVETSCNGVCDASLSVYILRHSTPPYTYTWNPPVSTTATASNLCPGTYTTTVTDNNGCEAYLTSTVVEPPALTISGVVTDDCNGTSVGRIDITVVGGTPGYNFNWSNGATTEDLSNIAAGTYTVTVTDDNNCEITATYNVGGTNFTPTVTVTDITCFGDNDGAVDVTVSPTATYQFILDGPVSLNSTGTSASFTNLPPGTYTLQVWGVNCFHRETVVVEEPQELILFPQAGPISTSCNGVCDASVGVTIIQNSTPPYTYTWDPPVSMGPTATGLCPGDYVVTVTDANGCESYDKWEVLEPAAILIGGLVTHNCNGQTNGAIDITVSGGAGGPYTFNWSNGETTEDISGLTGGTYTVTVTDVDGCEEVKSYVVNDVSFTVTLTSEDVSCFGADDGSVAVTVTPGTTYLLLLSGPITPNSVIATNHTWTNLPPGSYNLLVWGYGCVFEQIITISEPDPIQLNFTTNDGCYDQANASVTVTPTGGTPGYTFAWDNGGSTATIDNLTPGTYTVTVTDAEGCEQTGSATVVSPSFFDVTLTINSVSCSGSGGSITANPIGGIQPYTYAWYDDQGNLIGSSATINNLPPGDYTVRVWDANGCLEEEQATIVNVEQFQINMLTTNVNCFTGGGGTASVNVIGTYVQPLVYDWSGPSINAGNQNNTSQVNLSPGTYTVTVTDANGCSATTSGVVSNGNLVVTASATSIDCANPTGTVSVDNVTGGTAPYTYNWVDDLTSQSVGNTVTVSGLGDGTYTVTVTDANGCSGTATVTISVDAESYFSLDVTSIDPACYAGDDGSITVAVDVTPPSAGTYTFVWSSNATNITNAPGPPPSETANNLPAGTYSVTVTNGLGCSHAVTVTLTDPAPLALSATTTDPSAQGASDGSIDLTVTGGTPGYTYAWSNGATTEDISYLPAGNYCVTVTDINACTITDCYMLIDTPPTLLMIPEDESCYDADDGSITLDISGMTPPFTYLWSNGATTSSLSGLPAGSYSVTVTDINGVVVSGTTTVGQPTEIVPTFNVDGVSCAGANDANIDLEVTGGDPPYTYLWNTGDITQDIGPVMPGTYTVTITDLSVCVQVGQVIVDDVPLLQVTLSPTDPTCNAGAGGSITTTVSGGTPGYTYNWSNGDNVQNPTGLAAGTYTVTVTDANGCEAIQSTTLVDPILLEVQAYPYDEQCGDMSGGIDLDVTGGTPGYTYAWSNGATTQNIFGLGAGSYDVTVTDMNGCQEVLTNIVVNDIGLMVSFFTIDPTCGLFDGVIVVDAPGASQPVTYEWSNGVVTQNPVLSGLGAGTYTVTVTGAVDCVPGTGCSAVATVTLNDGNFTVSVITTDVNCGALGAIDLYVAGGTPPYTFNWSTGDQTQNISGLTVGSYDVTITDDMGCMYTGNYGINQVGAGLYVTPNVSQPNCGQTDGYIEVTVDPGSGTSPYTFNWSTGDVTPGIYNLGPGTYTVTVTDAMGACYTETFVQDYFTNLEVISEVTDASCGVDDGTITLDVINGWYPMTFTWSNGATTQDLSSLAPGSYTVTVVDDAGCSVVHTAEVLQGSSLAYNALVQHPTCANNDGEITLTVNGGGPPITYNWSDGATTAARTNLPPGIYSVTITDDAGCSSTYGVELVSQSPLILNMDGVPGTCGNDDGSLDLTVNYGTPPYTYLWSNGESTEDISNLGMGVYTVTVTDANGCTAQGFGEMFVDPGLVLDVSHVFPTCGNNDGELTVTPIGGVGPYAYLWSTGATTATITNLQVGFYEVTVTDANGCSGTGGGELPNVFGPSIEFSIVPEMTACGGNNGEVLAIGNAVNPPVTYVWDNGATGPLITGLSEGYYYVTATDAQGCVAVDEVYVYTHSDGLYFTAVKEDLSDCYSSDGDIYLELSAGQAPYTIQWSTGATSIGIYGQPAGNYTVTVTDANGCSSSEGYTLTGDAQIDLDYYEVIPTSCGNADGSILIDVSGNTGPYTFEWMDANNNPVATTQDLTNVAIGNYGVTVTDAIGCTKVFGMFYVPDEGDQLITDVVAVDPACGATDGSITITVNNNNPPFTFLWDDGSTDQNRTNLPTGGYHVTVTDASGCVDDEYILLESSLLGSATTVNETCGDANGEIHLTITGGTPPYSYNWNHGASTADLTNLTAGTYYVDVLDVNGCSYSSQFEIENISNLTLAETVVNPSTCGASDGSITLTVGGTGTPPYTYLWEDGTTSANRSGLTSGYYFVTVTDDVGCEAELSVNLFGSIALTASVTNESCQLDDGEIDLTVLDGIGPYTFHWNDGNYGEDVMNLIGGNYSVTVVDANNCVGTLNATVQSGVVGFVFDYAPTTPDCGLTNGGIDLSVQGGSGPYTYSWRNIDGTYNSNTEDITGISSGIYLLTITDANGCMGESVYVLEENNNIDLNIDLIEPDCGNGDNGSIVLNPTGGTAPYSYFWPQQPNVTGNSQTNLSAGMYPVIVTDANGCEVVELIWLVNNTQLQATYTVQDIDCNHPAGSIDLTPIGSAIYFDWSNGASTEDISDLDVGTYDVVFRDESFCVNVIQGIQVREIAPMDIIENGTSASCGNSDGAMDITVTGGAPPYTFLWSNGATTEDITNVPSGVYGLTITDANGCIDDGLFVLVDEDNSITTSITVVDATCGLSNGEIYLNPTGGVGPYTYDWVFDGGTSQNRTDLAVGMHAVIITDANGCHDYHLLFVDEQGQISLTPSIQDIECGNAGSINLAVNGGAGGFTYLWSDGQMTNPASFSSPGDYSVTVTDVNGCEKIGDFYVDDLGQTLTADFIPSNSFPLLGETVTFTNTSTGSGTITYEWQVDGTTVSNALDFNYTFNDPAVVTITLVATNGTCTDQVDMVFDLTTGARIAPQLEEPAIKTGIDPSAFTDRDISIYPNPTDGNVMLRFNSKDDWMSDANIEVYNAVGEQLKQMQQFVPSSGQLKLDVLNGKAAGIYLFRVKTATGYYTKKVTLTF